MCLCLLCQNEKHRFEKVEGKGCDQSDGEIMSAIMNQFFPLHF